MTTQRITRYVRLVVDASGAKSGGRETKRALDDINRSARRTASAMDSLKRVFLGVFAGFGVREIARYADQWNLIAGRLELVEGSAAAAAIQQERLLDIANAGRTTLDATATLYTRMGSILKELGVNTMDLTDATEAMILSYRISGATAAESSNSARQFAQALGAGALRGEELQSVLEQNIPISKAIAKEFGVTVVELKKLGEAGELVSDRVLKAAIDNLAEFQEQAESLPETITGAFQVLQNEFVGFLGRLDGATGITNALAKAILLLAENIDTVAVFLGVLATTALPAVIAGMRALTAIALANPIGLIAVGVAGAVSALYELSDATVAYGDRTATLGEIMSVVWGRVTGLLGEVYNVAANLFEDWYGWLMDLEANTDASFLGIGNIVKSTVNFVIAVGKSMVDIWIGYFDAIFAGVIAWLKKIGELALQFARFAVLSLLGAGEDARRALIDALSTFDLSGVDTALSDTARRFADNFARDFVAEAGGAIAPFVQSAFDEVERRDIGATSEGAPADAPSTFTPAASASAGRKGRGGGGKGKSLADEFKKLTEALNPAIAAERELAEVQKLLNSAVAAGLVSQERANAMLAQKSELLRDQLDPLAAVHAELDRGIELARLSNSEREIESQLRTISEDLQGKGISLTQQETEVLRRQVSTLGTLESLTGDIVSVSEILTGGLRDILDQASTGLTQAASGVRIQVRSMVSDILAQIARNSLKSALAGLFGGPIAGALGGLVSASKAGVRNFAATPSERPEADAVEAAYGVQTKDHAPRVRLENVNVFDPAEVGAHLNPEDGTKVIVNDYRGAA